MSKNTSGDGLLVNYRFCVEFLDQSASGPIYFQKISGLNARVETETITSGGENDCVYQLPTTFKYNNLVLEKGLTIGDSVLESKINTMFSSYAFSTFTVRVSALNKENKPAATWMLVEAWPVGWSISDPDANSNNVIINTLELAYKRIEKL